MRRVFSIFPWLFLLMSISPLLVWACMGFFSRYLADDYSTSHIVMHKGFWEAQVFWYLSWSGRYSFNFVIFLVELAGVRIVPWIPFVALSAWFLSLCWALKQIFQILSIPVEKKWLAILTGAILFASAKSLTDYSEVIFWQTGILTYQISNIFLPFFLALFLKRFFAQPQPRAVALWEYGLAFVIAFILGGFSETWAVMQLALLILSLLYFLFLYKDHQRLDILRFLLLAFAGSIVALIVIVKAPGNVERTIRMTGIPLSIVAAGFMTSIQDAPVFLAQWFMGNTAIAFGLFITGLAAGFCAIGLTDEMNKSFHTARSHLIVGAALLIAATSLISAGFFPSFAVWGSRPVDRAVFIPMFIFAWMFALFGFFCGRFLRVQLRPEKIHGTAQIFLFFVLTFAMLWVQVRAVSALVQRIPALQVYARLWDERDSFLHQAGVQQKGDIVLPSLRHNPALHDIQDTIWVTGELAEDRLSWINRAAARYYGVKSISGK